MVGAQAEQGPAPRLPDGSPLKIIEHPSGNRTILIPRYRGLDEPPAPAARQGEVNWYIPFTAVHPLTVEAAPPDAIWVDVSSSVNAYYGALLDIWARGETFAVLEHDVVCRPDVIREFEECPEPWCTYGYHDICHPDPWIDEDGMRRPSCMEAWRNALGCTRFRRELIKQVPDALAAMPEQYWDWHNTCDGLGAALRAAGFTHHWHRPMVRHHRGVQSPEHAENYLAGVGESAG